MVERPTWFKLLLCLLVAGQSTSITVRHAHDLGGIAHGHGFGLFRPEFSAADSSGKPNGSASDSHHAHFVFLGIEFFTGENGGPTPTAPSSDKNSRLGQLPAPATTDMRAALLTDLAGVPDFLADLPAVSLATSSHSSRVSLPPQRCDLCDRARGERSGVHLI